MAMTRLSKILLCAMLGLFAGLIAFDNVADYGTNYAYAQHVLSMDTTYADNTLRYRSITSPLLWRTAYGFIIAVQAATSVLFLVATAALWRTRNASAARFNEAKRWAALAGTAGFALWFFGFTVIGGEWFSMWQSQRWNGQAPAFRIYMTVLAVLLYVNQPDPASDLAANQTGQ